MPTGMEQLHQFAEETIDELLKELPLERRLQGLTVEERLQGLRAEERLQGLTAKERIHGLSVDEILAALSAETRVEFARLLEARCSQLTQPAANLESLHK
jgi:hypothetical protein